MSDTKKVVNVQNIDQPNVQELLNRFKKRHEMNVVDVAEIIAKLITTLKVDHEEGRHKNYSISVGHLGEVLGIGKGVISQFMSVWNMPQESKDFLRSYNIALNNAYQTSRLKGKDEVETIKLQKKYISEECISSGNGIGKRTDVLLHSVNTAEMILKSVCNPNKIPQEIFEGVEIPVVNDNLKNTHEHILQKAKVYKFYIERCINHLCPRISKLTYLQKELEFCNVLLENNIAEFCGNSITKDCLNKQIKLISEEILSVEAEQKTPQIAQLLMAKNDLEKNI